MIEPDFLSIFGISFHVKRISISQMTNSENGLIFTDVICFDLFFTNRPWEFPQDLRHGWCIRHVMFNLYVLKTVEVCSFLNFFFRFSELRRHLLRWGSFWPPPKVHRVKAVSTLIQFALYAFEIKNTFNTNLSYVPNVFEVCITPSSVAMLVKTQKKAVYTF